MNFPFLTSEASWNLKEKRKATILLSNFKKHNPKSRKHNNQISKNKRKVTLNSLQPNLKKTSLLKNKMRMMKTLMISWRRWKQVHLSNLKKPKTNNSQQSNHFQSLVSLSLNPIFNSPNFRKKKSIKKNHSNPEINSKGKEENNKKKWRQNFQSCKNKSIPKKMGKRPKWKILKMMQTKKNKTKPTGKSKNPWTTKPWTSKESTRTSLSVEWEKTNANTQKMVSSSLNTEWTKNFKSKTVKSITFTSTHFQNHFLLKLTLDQIAKAKKSTRSLKYQALKNQANKNLQL